MADGQVVFEITGDPKGINQTVKQVTSNIQSESRKWDQAAGDATGNIEKSFANMAGKIVGSLTAAGIGAILLNWGKAAVEAASDLAEVQNVVDTVFGDGARQIEAWAKSAGQQFGLTETQAKKFTSTLGAMMKSSGIAGNEIVNMSTSLAGLAADMASFYNLDFETAFEKIRSGISGETEPLKQLGINMSVANLEAFALAQGLEKTFSQMDQGEQTMLRYQYLMQATSDAQGDFERTSDGFANAQRRIQTALTTISSVAGEFILTTIEPLISGVADFLEKITTTPERTVLDDFNDINVDTTEKMASLESTYQKAQSIITLLDEIGKTTVTLNNGSTITLEQLFGDLGKIEADGGDIRGYLEGLGVDVETIIEKYNIWKESTRQLTSLVPDLTNQINSETGAIEGGTEALQRNLDEWKKSEEKKLAWAAYYAKARAWEEKKAEAWKYELDAGTKANLLKQFEAEHQYLADLYHNKGGILELNRRGGDDVNEYVKLIQDATAAENENQRQKAALVDGEKELAAALQYTTDKYGEQEEAMDGAGDAGQEAGEKVTDAWSKHSQAVNDAIKALSDYVQGVHDATEQSVNSVLKGFESVSKAGDELRDKQTKLGEKYAKEELKYQKSGALDRWSRDGTIDLKAMSDAYDTLTDAEKDAYNVLAKLRNEQDEVNKSLDNYKPAGMEKNLQDQIAYMEEYLANLEQLKEWGVSADLIAFLSDGSEQSAEYLSGLVKGGEDAAQGIGEQYEQVKAAREGFVEELTQNKLAVDETFQGLVDAASLAVEELNLYDESKSSLYETIEGISAGIDEALPDVQSSVQAVLDELDRLSAFGMSFGFDGAGNIELHLDGSHAQGLDHVPFDGYLAELHEGEGILTAEENRIWQRFKNGQSSSPGVDYDALGGVMRDNVQAGGNVYLDGRTVGRVVSGIQGNQYRSLQRSGFQG